MREKNGKIEGRVALITGGGSGIGSAIAEDFGREGCTVVITGRTGDKLEHTAQRLKDQGIEIGTMVSDVRDSSSVTALFARVISTYGKLDILVNSASVFGGARFDLITDDQWRNMMATGLDGLFSSSREACRFMKDNGGGRIIYIGSVAAFRSREYAAAYSICKAAVSALTDSIALDGREFGIAASCLHPGNIMVERRADGRPGTGNDQGSEEMMASQDVADTALLMASLPAGTNLLEAVILPVGMKYLGRGYMIGNSNLVIVLF